MSLKKNKRRPRPRPLGYVLPGADAYRQATQTDVDGYALARAGVTRDEVVRLWNIERCARIVSEQRIRNGGSGVSGVAWNDLWDALQIAAGDRLQIMRETDE